MYTMIFEHVLVNMVRMIGGKLKGGDTGQGVQNDRCLHVGRYLHASLRMW